MSYLPVKSVNFLKSRLIFSISYFSCKQTFHIPHVCISKKIEGVLMLNIQHIIFIWRRRYWRIFKFALVYQQGSCLLRCLFFLFAYLMQIGLRMLLMELLSSILHTQRFEIDSRHNKLENQVLTLINFLVHFSLYLFIVAIIICDHYLFLLWIFYF